MIEVKEVLAGDDINMIDQMMIGTGRLGESIRREEETVTNIGKKTDIMTKKSRNQDCSPRGKEEI